MRVLFLCARLRIYALALRRFALVLHYEFCSLLSVTNNLGGPISPVLGKRSKQEKVHVYHILATTLNFAIRLTRNTFRLRAETW